MSESTLQLRARLQAEQNAGRGAGSLATTTAAALAAATQSEAVAETEPMLSHSRTFVHQVAGGTTIMPDGKRLVFGGKHGLTSLGQVSGFGYYLTDLPAEIEWLEGICKFPTSQITELVADPVTAEEKLVVKRVDPAIAQSALDAAHNTERVFNLQANAAVDNLPKTIAKDFGAVAG